MTGQRTRFEFADGLLFFTAFVWGINFPIAKHVLAHVPPMLFSGARFLLGSLVLFLLLALRGQHLGVPRRDLPQLAMLGLIGIAAFQGFWSNGVALTTASKAAILVNLSPIIAAIMLSFGPVKPGMATWIGVSLSFAGVFLTINNSLSEITLGGGTLAGDLMMIGAAALWSLYTVIAQPILARLGPLRVTAWSMLIGALALLPFAAWSARDFSPGGIGPGVWLGFAYTVTFAGAFGFAWWYEGVRRIGASRTMVYSNMIPVFAIATAVVLLGEEFTLLQTLGAAIVLAGIALTRRG
ncbi:MAG: EamA family transporter [Alphaproteobacteria bacterium]|nr:EamA family transporter [Alphaproteobacteria bacterium]